MFSAIKRLGRKTRSNSALHAEAKVSIDVSNKENVRPSNSASRTPAVPRQLDDSIDLLLKSPEFVNKQYEELILSKNPDHDIREQMFIIATHEKASKSVRQRLEKTRSESATYKANARQLKKDCDRLQASLKEAVEFAQAQSQRHAHHQSPRPIDMAVVGRTSIRYNLASGGDNVVMDVVAQKDHEAVIRAAEDAAKRHEKELRGMALQMQWMQARWEREAKLRGDAAFAKRFLELKISLAEAWYVTPFSLASVDNVY